MTNPHKAETSSPELDAFLASHTMRRLTGAERREWLHELFHPEDEITRPDPQDLGHRIMVMWRICRTTAVIKGLCASDETLDSATEIDPDPWVTPTLPIISPMAGAALRKARAGRLLKYHAEGDGLPLLPPRDNPKALDRWCAAAGLIAADLGVERTREGLLGLHGLLDPQLAKWSDVSASEVMSFEETIMEDASNLLQDNGERAAVKHFRENYGFSLKEAKSLIRLVRSHAVESEGSSIEEARALTLRRLEDILGRAKENMDTDTELKTIKEIARIQGLTRTEPENQTKEFFAVVADVSRDQDSKNLDAKTLALIQGRRSEEVEPVTIEIEPTEPEPEDEEALAEFDKENR